MTFTRSLRDPIDGAREELERAHDHLARVRERVEAGELDGNALTMAELAAKHAHERWQAILRGDSDPQAMDGGAQPGPIEASPSGERDGAA